MFGDYTQYKYYILNICTMLHVASIILISYRIIISDIQNEYKNWVNVLMCF